MFSEIQPIEEIIKGKMWVHYTIKIEKKELPSVKDTTENSRTNQNEPGMKPSPQKNQTIEEIMKDKTWIQYRVNVER